MIDYNRLYIYIYIYIYNRVFAKRLFLFVVEMTAYVTLNFIHFVKTLNFLFNFISQAIDHLT